MNWQVSGASALSEIPAARSSCSSDERPDRRRGRVAVALKQVQRFLPGDRRMLLRMPRVDVGHHVPRHALDRLPGGEQLGELDLDWIHGADVMHYDANRAAVVRDRRVPLLVGERRRQRGKRAGSLFEPFRQRVGATAGGGGLSVGRVLLHGGHGLRPLYDARPSAHTAL